MGEQATKSVELREERGGYDILLDGEIIGVIEGRSGRLADMMIDENLTGEGYGTQALAEWVEREQEQNETLETSVVVSPAMEAIIRRVGGRIEDNHGVFD